jgi:hypothetical protein
MVQSGSAGKAFCNKKQSPETNHEWLLPCHGKQSLTTTHNLFEYWTALNTGLPATATPLPCHAEVRGILGLYRKE